MIQRKRVLIVEDNCLLLELTQEMLEDLGWTIVATSGKLDEALELAQLLDLDFAVLDLGLGDEFSYPVADMLLDRAVPFLISSGQSSESIPGRFAKVVRLHKPFVLSELKDAIDCVEAQ